MRMQALRTRHLLVPTVAAQVNDELFALDALCWWSFSWFQGSRLKTPRKKTHRVVHVERNLTDLRPVRVLSTIVYLSRLLQAVRDPWTLTSLVRNRRARDDGPGSEYHERRVTAKDHSTDVLLQAFACEIPVPNGWFEQAWGPPGRPSTSRTRIGHVGRILSAQEFLWTGALEAGLSQGPCPLAQRILGCGSRVLEGDRTGNLFHHREEVPTG